MQYKTILQSQLAKQPLITLTLFEKNFFARNNTILNYSQLLQLIFPKSLILQHVAMYICNPSKLSFYYKPAKYILRFNLTQMTNKKIIIVFPQDKGSEELPVENNTLYHRFCIPSRITKFKFQFPLRRKIVHIDCIYFITRFRYGRNKAKQNQCQQGITYAAQIINKLNSSQA